MSQNLSDTSEALVTTPEPAGDRSGLAGAPPAPPATPSGALPEGSATTPVQAPAPGATPKRKRKRGPRLNTLSPEEREERVVVRAIVRRVLRTVEGKVAGADLKGAARDLRDFVGRVGADLGGARSLSASQRTLLGLTAVRARVAMLMGGVLAASPALAISRGRNGSSPLARDFNSATDGLSRLLEQLGLQRVAAPVVPASELLRRRALEIEAAERKE